MKYLYNIKEIFYDAKETFSDAEEILYRVKFMIVYYSYKHQVEARRNLRPDTKTHMLLIH